MMSVFLFLTLICLTACQSKEIVVVQRCHPLPKPTWKTVRELYKDDVFVRSYLEECTKEKK